MDYLFHMGSRVSDLHNPLIQETPPDEAFMNRWFSVLGPSLTQSGAAGWCNGADREAAQISALSEHVRP